MFMNRKGVLNKTKALTLLAGLTLVTSARGEALRIAARQDSGTPSYFQLNFFDQDDNVIAGTPAFIASTEFELEIDGISGTARFLSYEQDIASLTLPGDIETGALHIQIVESEGTYDRTTGIFETHDTYLIQFENDLSGLGFPGHEVLLEDSVSSGGISLEHFTTGTISINWGRERVTGLLPFDFGYACTLSAVFSTTAASYVEVEMVQLVSDTTMPEALRATLMTYLNSAITAFEISNVRSGVNSLRSFMFKVRRSSQNVAQADADVLIAAANTGIALAENRLDQVFIQAPQGPLNQMMAPAEGSSEKGDTRVVR